MKKILFITIGLLMAYMSFGQINGNSCLNAIPLDHTQNISSYTGTGETEIWFSFIADTSYLKFFIDNIPNSEIGLFQGPCSNLQLLEYNKGPVEYNSLVLGNTYYLKIINSTSHLFSYNLLSTKTNDGFDFCDPPYDCFLIKNGLFNQINNPIGAAEYNQGGNQIWYNTISYNNITAWSIFHGTVDMMYSSGNYYMGMIGKYIESYDGGDWGLPTEGGYSSEMAIACTELFQDDIYILKYKYKTNSLASNFSLNWGISTDDLDDEIDFSHFLHPNLSDFPTNNVAIPFEAISTMAVTNTDFEENTVLFIPSEDYNRMYVYPISSVAQPSGLDMDGAARVMVDNISITPIEYNNITTCKTSYTLEQPCASNIINTIGPNIFTWTITSGNGTIQAGTETSLTPTITGLNGITELELTVTYNNVLYTTTVQVTHEPLEVSFVVTDESCVGAGDGTIDLTVIGGTPDYTFEWESDNGPDYTLTGDANAGDISGLVADNYGCSVSVAEGCSTFVKPIVAVGSFDITENSSDTWENESCGTVEAIPNSGSGDYTWVWEDASNTNIGNTSLIINLSVGTYSYTITDDITGCEETGVVTVGIGPSNTLSDMDIFVCSNQINNYNLIMPSGTPNFTNYTWSTGDTGPSINISDYGDYTCNAYLGTCHSERTFHVRPYELDINVDISGNSGDCSYIGIINSKRYNFSATPGYVSYVWNITTYYNIFPVNPDYYTGNSSSIYDIPLESGTDMVSAVVTVSATTLTGCVETTSINLNIEDEFNAFMGSENDFPNMYGTWEEVNYMFFTDITISSGNQLNIINSTIQFAEGYGIIVEDPGTRLTINNSTIEGLYCSEQVWKGILVDGNPANHHVYNWQPTVFINNNSIISGAEKAVKSIEGGIIDAQDSRFINNNYGIYFDIYYNDETCNASNINSNIFEVNGTGNTLSGFDFIDFVHLNKIPSMELYQNIFKNEIYQTDITDRGTGLYAFAVNTIEVSHNNSFENLTQGANIVSSQVASVSDNNFENNYQGLTQKDIYNLSSQNNFFDDGGLMPIDNAYQMRVIGCTSPNIYNNNFNNGVVGLNLAKGNPGNFRIYKNTFEGFDTYSNSLNGHPTAILTKGNHGSINDNTGAEIKCNTFKDYDYAIAIMSGEIKRDQGHIDNQNPGNPQAPAGNTFDDDADGDNMPDGRFFVDQSATDGKYWYYHHMTNITLIQPYYTDFVNIGDPYAIPVPVTGTFLDPNDISASCPDLSPWGTGLSGLAQTRDAVNATKSVLGTKEQDLASKVDQGNTELLLSDILIANDNTYTELVQEIQAIDSYISEQAAIEFMDKPTNRPVAKTIGLIANSPLPEAAKEKIKDLDLSDELIDYIEAHQDGLSKLEIDEIEINQLKFKKAQLLREAVQMVYKDETGELFEDVIALLLEQDNWKQKEMAYHMLSNNKLYERVEALRLELTQDLSNYSAEEQYIMEDYLDLIELETSIDTLPDSLRIVSIAQEQVWLESIINSETSEGAILAELLLVEAGLLEEEAIFIQLPNPETTNRSAVQKQNKQYNFAGQMDILELYPNPVDDKLTVEYIMFNGQSVNGLGIYNINGKLLMTQKISNAMGILDIDVSSLASGTYIMAFGSDGISSNSKKFIVK